MKIAMQVDDRGLEEELAKIEGIDTAPKQQLGEGIGRLVQEQTRQRIEEDKTAPDGTPWRENRSNNPILFQSGALSRSVDYVADHDGVTVGSGMIYASVHQGGKTIKPKSKKALVFQLGNAGARAQSHDTCAALAWSVFRQPIGNC